MKKIMLGLLTLLIVSLASALEIDVDCKDGRWDSHSCLDSELEDEFDQVEDAVNQNEEDIAQNSEDIVSGDEAVMDYSDKMDKNVMIASIMGDLGVMKYSDLRDAMVLMKMLRGDAKLMKYIETNEDRWLEDADTHDGSGYGKGGIEYLLWGEYGGFEKYGYYAKYMEQQNALMWNSMHERMDRIEAITILKIARKPINEESIIMQTALVKSDRTGKHVKVDEWECNGRCIRLTDAD